MVAMGFGNDRIRINNRYGTKVRCTINDHSYYFKSKIEYAFAMYLNFLLDCNEIVSWEYEPKKFLFPDQTTAPCQYTPDFRTIDKDGDEIWYEVKTWGNFEGKDKTKQARMKTYHPDVNMVFVLDRIPAKQKGKAHRLQRVRDLCSDVIEFNNTKKSLKGLVNFEPSKYDL